MSKVELFSSRPVQLRIEKRAFQHNIQIVEKLAPHSEVMLVLKANAYGHGLFEMASLAGNHQIAVAIPEEADCLIGAGIKNRIWVLEGPFSFSCLKMSHNNDIVWVIHSAWQLALILSFSAEYELRDPLQICLKLDSGMHRLGLSKEAFIKAAVVVNSTAQLELLCTMSHFASSDLPLSNKVLEQINNFNEAIKQSSLEECPKSLSNSGGVLYYPESHRDLVRPGIMLYGAMPNPESSATQYDLKPVMAFRSAIISLNAVAKGQGVGYGSTWKAPRDSIIATVAGGYGDGYPRHAQHGTPVGVFINGGENHQKESLQIAPLVGRVSMDMLMIDVTDIRDVGVGNLVEFWGQHISIDEVAKLSETIAYDLMCGITTRVPRVYY